MNSFSIKQIEPLKALFPQEMHGQLMITGGGARDLLRGVTIRDFDLVVLLTIEELSKLGFRLVEGVTTAPIWFRHLPEIGKIEITRIESHDELEMDLLGRDFRLNAIIVTLDGEVFDPLGGRGDLENMTLVPCGDNAFRSDPIRIFRGFRFEAEGFVLSEESKRLIGEQDWEEELAQIPVERFSREMLKALEGEKPGRFFENMISSGAGRTILPELFRMPDVPAGPLQYHPEGDLLTHCLQVLERVAEKSTDPLARFCAFFHDLGKLLTLPKYYPKHHGHNEAGFPASIDFCRRLMLPAAYGQALAWTSMLHGNANRLPELRDSTKIKMAQNAIKGGIREILPLVAQADKGLFEEVTEWNLFYKVADMNTVQLGIDLQMLEEMKPSIRGAFIHHKRVNMLKELLGN